MGRLGECQGTRSAVAKRVKKSGPGRGANGGERADGMLPKKNGGFYHGFYGTYPLEMEVLYGFMGKSWEYMGLPSGYLT